MANLSDTIHTISASLDMEMLQGNSMCFITTNGVAIGTPIRVNSDNATLEDIQDITKYLYSLSIKHSKKINETEEHKRNLHETILLENVRYKIGNTTLNLKHLVLNNAQIVALYAATEDVIEQFLESLQL